MPKFTGSTVEIRSVEPYFTAERAGRKPNTLRQMTDAEYAATLVCERVRIVGPDSATFEREITSVVDVNDIFELETCDRLVVISWKHKSEHVHSYGRGMRHGRYYDYDKSTKRLICRVCDAELDPIEGPYPHLHSHFFCQSCNQGFATPAALAAHHKNSKKHQESEAADA